MTKAQKPLGHKNYGHIPHLPGSRRGPGDHACHEGQSRIATLKTRDKHDTVIVTVKIDGSNVGVARIGNVIHALSRAGYPASTSPWLQHHLFDEWVSQELFRFLDVLKDGERLVGEWIAQAHGTRYRLVDEPFIAFDLMRSMERTSYTKFMDRVGPHFCTSHVIHWDRSPCSIERAREYIEHYKDSLRPQALDPIEGAVWRVERDKLIDRSGRTHHGERKVVVDFLAKWVRPGKVDGKYLPREDGDEPVWNWKPMPF